MVSKGLNYRLSEHHNNIFRLVVALTYHNALKHMHLCNKIMHMLVLKFGVYSNNAKL